MVFNVKQVLKAIDGTDLMSMPDKKVITLAGVCCNALMNPKQGEGWRPKLDKAFLTEKIYKAEQSESGDCELSAEDIVKIKDAVGEAYGQSIVFAAHNILEGVRG